MEFLAYLKNKRIKLLKYLITLVVFFFILCVIFEIFKVLFDDVYNTITLTYILLIVIINFVPEFSPYILNNYLIYIFPFLSKYSGRGAVYILIGLATISPELNKILNIGGYILIGTGVLCLYMNWLLAKNLRYGYQDNYQTFNHDDEKKEELNEDNYENNNNSGRNSNNSDNKSNDRDNKIIDNDNSDKDDDENLKNNLFKFQEALNSQNNQGETIEDKKIEMKELEK